MTRPVNEKLDISSGEINESVSAPKPETQNRHSEEDESEGIVTHLEAYLTMIRKLFIEMKEKAEAKTSELSVKISSLQIQRDSLLYELEQTTKEINDSKSIQAILRERIAALESKFDEAKSKLEKSHNSTIDVKPQLLSEAENDKADQGSQSYVQKQVETSGAAEQNQEISEVNISVEKTIDEEQSPPSAEEFEVSVLKDVDITENEQVKPPQQQEAEPSIENTKIQSDKQGQIETELDELTRSTAVTEDPVVSGVTLEEAKTADSSSVIEKVFFIKALSDIQHQDEATCINAIKTMGSIRHELSFKALVAYMRNESRAHIKTECIKAIVELNMKEGIPVIEQALTEKAVSVRSAAVRGLYRLAGAESDPALLHMLRDENADVRRRTATCIYWLGQKDLAVELVPLLDDKDFSVRRAAVEAMGNLRSRKVIPGLIRHLNDPDKRIRRAINTALVAITGKEMSRSFPVDEQLFMRLVARWQQWWKEQYGTLLNIKQKEPHKHNS